MKQVKMFGFAIMAGALSFTAACGQPQTAPESSAPPTVVESTPTVVTPREPATIVAAATADPRLTTLVSALTAAGLTETLSGPGPFTVFAPTNEAFAAVNTQVQTLLTNTDKAPLTRVLTYHVVPGRIMAADLTGRTATPATVAGPTLSVAATATGVQVGGANVTQADIVVGNGVIHIIDKVLLPPAR